MLARLVWLSAALLFVEMLLIRWIGTEVRVFAYLQNAVLVAAFLGLGLGCRNAARPARLLPAAVSLAAIGVFIRDPFGWGLGEAVTQGLTSFQDSLVWARWEWSAEHASPLLFLAIALAATLLLLLGVALVFQPLGQWLGRWIDEHPRPIAAYSANLVGSLLGIAAFDLLTILERPPFVWLAVAALGLAALAPQAGDSRPARAVAVGLLLGTPLLAIPDHARLTVWSPYQKLSLERAAGASACGVRLDVNNTGYQLILDLDPRHMLARPDIYPPAEISRSHYFLPHLLVGARRRALVVGAGTGNDVAAALVAGIPSVRAVEIDPAIVDLGRAHHPNRPYSSERVSVTVDDARAFFRRDTGSYDLIWFGLLDSHTTPSAYTNVRLDNFVYTRESFAEMKRLLAPDGVVVLFFEPQTTWIADRLVGLMQDAFGNPPLVLRTWPSTPCLGWGGLLLIGGSEQQLEPLRARVGTDPELQKIALGPETFPLDTERPTDDWPYLYLPSRGVPRFYLLVGASAIVLGALLRRRMFRSGEGIDLPLLLLGAGFMLLEVTGVSRAALLYGTTWTVNAYVVAAILAMALFANLVAALWAPRTTGWPAAGLLATILAIALIPTAWLAGLAGAWRVVAGGAFLAMPIFFSGLVFVEVWAGRARKDLALGSNLLGSLAGGIASMLTTLVGFRALAFLTLACYLAALLLVRREQVSPPPAPG